MTAVVWDGSSSRVQDVNSSGVMCLRMTGWSHTLRRHRGSRSDSSRPIQAEQGTWVPACVHVHVYISYTSRNSVTQPFRILNSSTQPLALPFGSCVVLGKSLVCAHVEARG